MSTEEDLMSKMEICKYIKDNYQFEKNEVFDKIFDLEKQFFKYIEKKVNLKYGKKQWQKMIDYLDILSKYFALDETNIVFDSFYDYFLYISMNPQTTKGLVFKMGIEGWAYFKYGVAYSRLKRYDLAENNLNCCIKCSPMSFVAYDELLKIAYIQKDFQKLKRYLDNSHKLVKTSQDLGTFYYYYALYTWEMKNYQLTKAICQVAVGLDMLPSARNKLLEIFKDLMESNKVVVNVFATNPDKVLIKNNVPIWFSFDIMLATLMLYKACLSKIIDNKSLQLSSRKSLMFYRLQDYVTQIETNVLTNENMFMFENCEVCVKLKKKWQTRYKAEDDVSNGTLLEAIDGNNTLTIVLDKNVQCYDFETLCNENLNTLKRASFKIINCNKIETINGKQIFTAIVENQENTKVCMMFTQIEKMLFVVTTNIGTNKASVIKELYNIIDTLRPFNSINHKLYNV